MNVLVLGSGGREHAITWALRKSPLVDVLYAAPGNGGTGDIAENVPGLDIMDAAAVLAFVRERNIGLVVIGPEAPLVAGVADALREAGVAVFGPNADGAQLEGSKAYSKQFMLDNNIPTAAYAVFDNEADALAYVRQQGAPIVIKADGLAAGKGVVVAETLEDAEEAVRDCFAGAFGAAGSTVVVEECMTGPECSLLSFVTAGTSHPMVAAQDHKRAFDGDAGPNTGGMGVYSPVPIVSEEEMAAMEDIMARAAAATAREPFGLDYRGTLYGGFMLTPEGPKIVEFNARFGDSGNSGGASAARIRPRGNHASGCRGAPPGHRPALDRRLGCVRGACQRGLPGLLREGQGDPGHRRGRGFGWRSGVPCRHCAQRRWRAAYRRRSRAERGGPR